MNRYVVSRGCLFLATILCFAGACFAQPPAQGPAWVDPNAQGALTVSMSVILNTFETTVQAQIDSMNAQIEHDKSSTNIGAHVSYSYKAFPPYMTPTLATDMPNENQIRMPLMVTYDITDVTWHGIPYFSRSIGQSIDLYASCNGWWTDTGSIRIQFVAQPGYLDGNSFGEEALNFFISHLLSNVFDGRLRGAVQGQRDTTDLKLTKCNCLGVAPGADEANHYKGSAIVFQKKTGRFGNIGNNNSVLNNETITIQSVKRLAAHDLHGAVLYNDSEDIGIELWINHLLKLIPVGAMKENDVRTFDNLKIIVPRPADTSTLVLIANVLQQSNNYLKDSQFGAYDKRANFGTGTKTLTVTKSYWQQPIHLPGGGMTKPIKVTVPAYEITLKIDLPGSQATM